MFVRVSSKSKYSPRSELNVYAGLVFVSKLECTNLKHMFIIYIQAKGN